MSAVRDGTRFPTYHATWVRIRDFPSHVSRHGGDSRYRITVGWYHVHSDGRTISHYTAPTVAHPHIHARIRSNTLTAKDAHTLGALEVHLKRSATFYLLNYLLTYLRRDHPHTHARTHLNSPISTFLLQTHL